MATSSACRCGTAPSNYARSPPRPLASISLTGRDRGGPTHRRTTPAPDRMPRARHPGGSTLRRLPARAFLPHRGRTTDPSPEVVVMTGSTDHSGIGARPLHIPDEALTDAGAAFLA